ncbi:hypothetical protein SAMN05421823_11727 [Catalinimonas alkaloidigena]|uniref:Zinc-finger n=1 Tax=Catalinimonas alkaloidigena TaxID=1075417 RepID=A0A1G9UNN0_9BACT|nr:hypothetical protein [Catalinimonas alkaloidigena]SDM61552.1 hypothetical protein SAMN05421823_11727 [Catalinimonas alkaloidigena]
MISDEELMALMRYVDGECTDEEATAIRAQLAHDPAYRRAYNEVRQADEALAALPLLEPSTGFNFRVLNQLKAEPHKAVSPISLRKRLLHISGIAIFLLVLPSVLLLLSSGQNPVLILDGSWLPAVGDRQAQVALGPYLQPLLFVNGLLTLLLFDRGVLQPWFRQRHQPPA